MEHAKHSEQFVRLVMPHLHDENLYLADWLLVVIFYSALHYTKAYILERTDGQVSSDRHTSRYDPGLKRRVPGHNDLVKRAFLQQSDIYFEYHDLYDLSIQARYQAFFKKPDEASKLMYRKFRALEKIRQACGY